MNTTIMGFLAGTRPACASIVAVALWAASVAAHAQAFPVKPIRLVIPNAPGGIDLYARVVFPRMAEELGQPVIIENRPGASGIIGAEFVSKSAPDGYNVLFATSGILVSAQFLNKNVPINMQRDLTPISQMLGIVSTITVAASSPIRTVTDLVNHAKKNPGKLSYGSSGIGTIPHMNGEIFKDVTGVDLLHVPTKGTAQLMTEMLAGRLDVDFSGLGAVTPYASTGKLRIIALQGNARFGPAGDTPSINETYPNYRDAPSWIALMGPAALPRPLVDRLHASVVKSMNLPEVRASYDKMGLRILASSPEELAAAMRSGSEFVGKLVKTIGLQPE
jgi:tripartite-type tricarboxylate transporter receptor subunit TctC